MRFKITKAAVIILAFALVYSLPLFSQDQKTIVIDPGHGGLEVGATGKFGNLEKDITLPISLKLKSIIERKLAYRVVLTRERDADVSLERRSAIANNNKKN